MISGKAFLFYKLAVSKNVNKDKKIWLKSDHLQRETADQKNGPSWNPDCIIRSLTLRCTKMHNITWLENMFSNSKSSKGVGKNDESAYWKKRLDAQMVTRGPTKCWPPQQITYNEDTMKTHKVRIM